MMIECQNECDIFQYSQTIVNKKTVLSVRKLDAVGPIDNKTFNI